MIDGLGGSFAERFLQGVGLGFILKVDRAERGHSEFCDHCGGHAGDFVEVIRGARGDGLEMEFFADTTTKRHGHAIHELVDVHEVDVSLREQLGVAESTLPAGDDADFEERVGVFEEPAADGVAGFVVGDGFLLGRVEDEGFLLEAADDALDGLFEVFELNGGGRATGS